MSAPFDPRSGGFFDLSARIKLRITGSDRLRFLNGQLTNDIGKVTLSSASAACVLNAKGKMDAHMFVSAPAREFWLDTDSEVREKLQSRLERYVIADDVQIEDVTAAWSLFHVLASNPPTCRQSCWIISNNRFRQPGWDIWAEAEKHDTIFEELVETFSFCDDSCLETFRMEQGIPRWGRELTEEINPIEANLEESCIDYEKGCYMGQEVISRMKMSGQRNKKLCGFISIHDAPLEPGMKLFPIGEEKEQGWITSGGRSKRLAREIALGYLRRPFPPAGFKLDARDPENTFGSPAIRVELVDHFMLD
jgi:folate-binding protein YgfZ